MLCGGPRTFTQSVVRLFSSKPLSLGAARTVKTPFLKTKMLVATETKEIEAAKKEAITMSDGVAMETKELHETDAYKRLSFQAKLQRMVAEYGVTVIVVHMTSCLSQLGLSFFAVYTGLDVIGFLKSIGMNSSLLDSQVASGVGSFAAAYVVYKILFPLRVGITLTVTPVLVRFLRRKGFIKPPKSKTSGIKKE